MYKNNVCTFICENSIYAQNHNVNKSVVHCSITMQNLVMLMYEHKLINWLLCNYIQTWQNLSRLIPTKYAQSKPHPEQLSDFSKIPNSPK